MKISDVLFLLILILTMALSCNSSRKISSGNVPSEISFGRTGGFTNIPDEYRIYQKGHVFKITRDDSTQINDISRKKMRIITGLLGDMDFEHLEINEPGNISYFVRVVTRDYENRVIWNDLTSNDHLKNFYKELLTTVKQ